MMGQVINHPFPALSFGGAAFTDNALAMARDAIKLPDVPEAVFWGAVCILAESPHETDRHRALQIWTGYATGFHDKPEMEAPEPQRKRPPYEVLILIILATPLVAGLFGRAVYEAVRAGGMTPW